MKNAIKTIVIGLLGFTILAGFLVGVWYFARYIGLEFGFVEYLAAPFGFLILCIACLFCFIVWNIGKILQGGAKE